MGHVWESLHVAAYVDEAFPAGSSAGKLHKSSNAGSGDLLPRGEGPQAALRRARQRIWADHCNERIWKGFYMLLFSQARRQTMFAGRVQGVS